VCRYSLAPTRGGAITDSTPAAAHRTVSRGLIGTLRGFLYAVAATSLAAALALFNEIRRFDEMIDRGTAGSVRRLTDAEEVTGNLLGLFSVAALVAGILAIVWWYQSYQAIDKTGLEGRSWSAGWAVGGWFIPFANLLIPKLVLDEIDRVSGAAEEGSTDWRDRRRLVAGYWWWWLFVAAAIVFAFGVGISGDEIERLGFNPDRYRNGLLLSTAGLTVGVPAALFGTAAVRVIGSRVSR
jgi:hypothetical protein